MFFCKILLPSIYRIIGKPVQCSRMLPGRNSSFLLGSKHVLRAMRILPTKSLLREAKIGSLTFFMLKELNHNTCSWITIWELTWFTKFVCFGPVFQLFKKGVHYIYHFLSVNNIEFATKNEIAAVVCQSKRGFHFPLLVVTEYFSS